MGMRTDLRKELSRAAFAIIKAVESEPSRIRDGGPCSGTLASALEDMLKVIERIDLGFDLLG
jgi:hypothetical protein